MIKRWLLSTIVPVQDTAIFADTIDIYTDSLSIFEADSADTWSICAILGDGFDRAALLSAISLAAAANQIPEPSINIRPLADTDWLSKVQGDFPPLRVGRIFLHGSHYKPQPGDGPIRLLVDAGMAFGSGEHQTTRGCLLALQDLQKRGLNLRLSPMGEADRPEPSEGQAGEGDYSTCTVPSPSHCWRNGPRPLPSGRGADIRILDMGCGSGILSLAAARLWRGQVVAVDIDPEAVNVTRRNARINGVARHIVAGAGNGYAAPVMARQAGFDVIVSNILARPLRRMAPDLARALNPGGYAVLSGLLQRQAPAVIAAHQAQGLRLVKRYPIGDWQSLVMKK
jgi:ribosomal protein L11 methyltransferase